MSFFGDIEKKLNSLAEELDKKLYGTPDAADPEIDAIKAEIENYSAAVSKGIIELGKVALARFEAGEAPDERSAEIYESIKTSRAAAEEAETRMEKLLEERKAAELLTKERICPSCGKICPPGMSFCGYCGNSLAGAEPVEKPAPVVEKPAANAPVIAAPVAEAPVAGGSGTETAAVEDIQPDEVVVPAAPREDAPVPAGKTCPRCGAAVADGLKFCRECGAKIEAAPAPVAPAPAPAGKTCPRCGAAVADGLKFCRECGARLDGPAAAATPAAAPAYKICQGCGAQLAPDKKFCNKCGTRQD